MVFSGVAFVRGVPFVVTQQVGVLSIDDASSPRTPFRCEESFVPSN